MIDISSIEPYFEDIDQFDIDILNKDVAEFGRDVVFARQLLNLDCSRIIQGYRIQQTIGYSYVNEITRTIYVIQTYFEDDLNNKLQQVIDLHKKNLEFEKDNPPILYDGKRYKKCNTNRNNKPKKARQTRIKFDENGEPIKSAAEIKLAAKVLKINALKFNLKLANNGNNTI